MDTLITTDQFNDSILPLDVSFSTAGNNIIAFDIHRSLSSNISFQVNRGVLDLSMEASISPPIMSDDFCIPMSVTLKNNDALDTSFQVINGHYADISLNISSCVLDLVQDFSLPDGKYPFYEGDVVVTPRKVAQVLSTKEKSMAQDVQINAIYYSKVSNMSGGDTVFIGKE